MEKGLQSFLKWKYALSDDCTLNVPDSLFEVVESFMRALSSYIPGSVWDMRGIEFHGVSQHLQIEVHLNDLATDFHVRYLAELTAWAQEHARVPK